MAFRVRRDTVSVLENADTSGNVLLNDSEANQVTQVRFGTGAYVPVTSEGTVLQGTYGFLTIMANGSYFYTASTEQADRLRAGVTGSDNFYYIATGSGGSSGSATLKFTVTGVNDAPVLTSTFTPLDSITEDETGNRGDTVSSILESSDVDSSALRGMAITGLDSGNGQWQFSTNGGTSWSAIGTASDGSALLLRSTDLIRFVPNGVNGTTASFTYRAWDQTSGSAGAKVDTAINGGQTAFSTATATGSVVVDDVNDAPVGVASSASGTEDGPPVTGQVQATDVDSATLTYALVANSAVGGSVSVDAGTGNYSFTPAADFSGTASFRFTASDGSLTSAPTTVTIAIAGNNDGPPVANADSAGTYAGTPVLINVLANDTDIDGDPLTISAVGTATHGTVQIENGQVRYSPAAGYTGSDSFTYTVSDGQGGTGQASVDVTVVPPPDGASAITITFRQGANGYTGAIDTMLRQNRSSTSFADAAFHRSILETGKEAQTLLRFDGLFGSGEGQIPLGATIVSATLTLQVTDGSSSGGTINRMLVGWNSSSTWSSLGSGVQINEIEATSAGAISIGSISPGSRTFNVTDSLAAWNAAASTATGQNGANLGWLFKAASINNWDFMSSQGAVKPVLSITYTLTGISPALPSVSIGAVTSAKENDGTITFSLSLSQASTQEIMVTVGTSDHTARSGTDYVAAARSITFLPGETTKTFDISLLNDGSAERLESFTVQINSATNAKIDTAVAIGRVTDDDAIEAPVSAINPTVVAVHNLADSSRYDGGTPGYGIGDPSGLAYVPSLGTLFVADSEHDESPYNSSRSLFSLRLDGSFIANHSVTSFTDEPTGLAYNPNNGLLYIADDDNQGVYWVSPSNPSVQLGFFGTARLGFVDTEDLKFDPLTGNIHILDGLLRQLVELTPQGQFVDSIPLPSVLTDAEALAYDSRHDVFFVASGASYRIWVIDRLGNVLATIDTLSAYGSTPKIKGLELAPSSNPNDGNALSLYVADYGSDQKNDGRLFEITLGSDWFF